MLLAATAEEKGLLGSKYYARHPVVPLGQTAINLNFDMILPLGVPESVVVTGAERTTAWPAVRAAAPFTVARVAPAVDLTYRRDLGPDARRQPHRSRRRPVAPGPHEPQRLRPCAFAAVGAPESER